ncbi:MAG: adenosylcobinamide-GDP ribazoletransferase [Nitrospiraceae bacterium]|nr:adenosylcobinamide-GDP ribazoletransferase [Nitrospiraceae bacterium]
MNELNRPQALPLVLRRVLLAIQFRTIVPVRVKGGVSEEELAGSVPFFPLAGAFQGILLAASSLVFLNLFGPRIAGGLALAVLIVSSGGFDLDGLADTADALAVKIKTVPGDPAAARQKRLAIMKEGPVGAMGAVAISLSVLLKYLLISGLLEAGYGLAGWPASWPADWSAGWPAGKAAVPALLALMPAFSKWATIPAMRRGRPARQDGLGRIFIPRTGAGDVAVSALLLAALWFAAFYPAVFRLGTISLSACAGFFILLLVFFYALSAAAARFFAGKWGGLTGDNLGALTELADVFFLLAALLWLGHLPGGHFTHFI